ncbi:hypothetical protein CDL15_Pgr009615 [Punica granatum]|uniref:Cytochrome P450 94A2-like n=1 Tax=Punica granatum TaxID=22663 RepID=A0A218WUC3_PUNGR|nr:hypothetical protein CDL15_Pgr009615 [Punica granatum]
MELTASFSLPLSLLLPLFFLLLAIFQQRFPLSSLKSAVYVALVEDRKRWVQRTSDLIGLSPTATYATHSLFGKRRILTGNPANVQHILKTRFTTYEKGYLFRGVFGEILGDGIFNIDGDSWKFQRQVSSHEFNTKSLRKFVETVVDMELNDRLIPLLSEAARKGTVLDMQDILQRFAFDNICKIAFGHDPACLLPSLPEEKFTQAFDEAVQLSSQSSSHSDEEFVIDIVISFIIAGRDTTSAALTWYFWLLSRNPHVENQVLREIREKSETPIYEDVKDLVYTHASLCESMRFYPPVPLDTKEATSDDILPDGTVIKKGTRVTYHPYAMGRSEKIWGPDWAEFKPERWLEKVDEADRKWSFVGRDSFTYPVFQAGPRICLGRETAFLQMKRVVSGVLRRFRIVPVAEEGTEPVFLAYLTSKMEGGFPVRIEDRED